MAASYHTHASGYANGGHTWTDGDSNVYTVSGWTESKHSEREYKEKINRTKYGIDGLKDALIGVLDDLYRPDAGKVVIPKHDPVNLNDIWIAIHQMELARRVEDFNRSARTFNASIDDDTAVSLTPLLNAEGHPIKGFPTSIRELDEGISDEVVIHILSELRVPEYHHQGVHHLNSETLKADLARFEQKEPANHGFQPDSSLEHMSSCIPSRPHHPHPTTYYHELAALARRRRQLRAAVGLHPFPVHFCFSIPGYLHQGHLHH